MRGSGVSIASLVVLAVAVATPGDSAEATPKIHSATELRQVLAEHAGILIEPPDVGYSWSEDSVTGDRESGSLTVVHSKVIYYFVHWGPIQVDAIDETYARRRIPELWPDQGLEVGTVEPATVAGHPAIFAEAVPEQEFYRAFFLIWNCPESGRQFIADMNYNIAVKTPRAELDAEIETTLKTLACHDGAPVTHLDSHPVLYANPAYDLRFSHPVHWYVFDSPYGVPHPAYAGFRTRQVGSVLAWLQDMEVSLRFEWSSRSRNATGSGETMAARPDLVTLGVEFASAADRVERFRVEEREMLRVGAVPVLKLTGTAEMSIDGDDAGDSEPLRKVLVLVASDAASDRTLKISAGVDYHRENGLLVPPHRMILDRWAVDLARGLSP